MNFICAVIALVLAIKGVIDVLNGNVTRGIILIIAACAIGPGGYFIFGSETEATAARYHHQ